jgi:hypothetical protein
MCAPPRRRTSGTTETDAALQGALRHCLRSKKRGCMASSTSTRLFGVKVWRTSFPSRMSGRLCHRYVHRKVRSLVQHRPLPLELFGGAGQRWGIALLLIRSRAAFHSSMSVGVPTILPTPCTVPIAECMPAVRMATWVKKNLALKPALEQARKQRAGQRKWESEQVNRMR